MPKSRHGRRRQGRLLTSKAFKEAVSRVVSVTRENKVQYKQFGISDVNSYAWDNAGYDIMCKPNSVPEHSMWRLTPAVPPEGQESGGTVDHILYTREGNQIIAKSMKVSLFLRLKPGNQNSFQGNPRYQPEYTDGGPVVLPPIVTYDGVSTGIDSIHHPSGEIFARRGILINPDTVIVHCIVGYIKDFPKYPEAVENWNTWNRKFLKHDGAPGTKCFQGTFFDAFKRINRNAITVMKYKKIKLSRDALYKKASLDQGGHPLVTTGFDGFASCDQWIKKVNFTWNWGPTGKILKFGNIDDTQCSNFDPVLFVGLTRPDGGPCGALGAGEPPTPDNLDPYPVEICGNTTLNYEDC